MIVQRLEDSSYYRAESGSFPRKMRDDVQIRNNLEIAHLNGCDASHNTSS